MYYDFWGLLVGVARARILIRSIPVTNNFTFRFYLIPKNTWKMVYPFAAAKRAADLNVSLIVSIEGYI
jgi:hypothetical protein